MRTLTKIPRNKGLNIFQRVILIIYPLYLIWFTILRVPWVVKRRSDDKYQEWVWDHVFKAPYHKARGMNKDAVGYAYVDTKIITIILLAGTAAAVSLFLLATYIRTPNKPVERGENSGV